MEVTALTVLTGKNNSEKCQNAAGDQTCMHAVCCLSLSRADHFCFAVASRHWSEITTQRRDSSQNKGIKNLIAAHLTSHTLYRSRESCRLPPPRAGSSRGGSNASLFSKILHPVTEGKGCASQWKSDRRLVTTISTQRWGIALTHVCFGNSGAAYWSAGS